MLSLFTFGSVSTPALVDSSSLSTITDTLVTNVGTILPWGLGILAVYIGVRQIPSLVKMFGRG